MGKIWLFDIDGVLTNPQKKKVPKALLLKLSILIDSNQPVAFVTGRSFAWAKARVIDQLDIKNPKNVFVSAEKGGVLSHFTGKKWTLTIDKKLAPPETLTNKVAKLIDEKFSKFMFLEPKFTMVTIEIRDGIDLKKFHDAQKELQKYLESYLVRDNLEKEFNIDSAIIATDVENKLSGKRLGTLRVFDWLQQRNENPDQFFAFGDTRSDIDIARTVFEKGHKVEFIFTGKKNLLPNEKLPFPVILYYGKYEKGTLDFLTKISI